MVWLILELGVQDVADLQMVQLPDMYLIVLFHSPAVFSRSPLESRTSPKESLCCSLGLLFNNLLKPSHSWQPFVTALRSVHFSSGWFDGLYVGDERFLALASTTPKLAQYFLC
jgi:hypothetical protein